MSSTSSAMPAGHSSWSANDEGGDGGALARVQRPRISVVVDNYNYRGFLPAAVESALRQDHDSFEVIVVDDGSTDGSRAVLERFRGRARLVFQDNRGQAAALNAGVTASRGEILCFLDADDWWHPDKLSRVAAAFDAEPDTVLTYHRLQPVRAGEARTRRPIPRSLCRGNLAPRMARSAGWWPFPMTSAIAVRRRAWDEAGAIPEAFRISADAWLVGIYPFLGPVAVIPDALGCYRIHNNNWFREVEDPAMIARRIVHWEATIDATNRHLEERKAKRRLDPADHLPLRVAKATLRGAGSLEQIRIFLAGVTFAGEPNLLRRYRDTLRTARMLAGRRSAPAPAPAGVPGERAQ